MKQVKALAAKSPRVILDWLPQMAAMGYLYPIVHFIKTGGLRKLLAGSGGCEALVGEYNAQKQLLLSLSTGLEVEFLDLGSKLDPILGKARSVQAECCGVNELISGHGEDPAIQFSFQLLKKAEDLVLGSYDQYADVFAVFQRLACGLREIELRQEQLRHTLRPLTVITIQFRIQSAILDGVTCEGFLTLAGEMNALLQEMQEVVERQFHDLEQIRNTSRHLMLELKEIIALHKGKISRTLQDSRNQFDALGQALRRSDEGVRNLAGQSTGIQTGINRVVMAMQCQDGACQKIQHVGQAIDEMVLHLQEGSRQVDRPEAEAELRQFLARANVIQLSQVQAVFSELDDAAGQIVEGIQVVEQQANALSAHSLTIGKNAVEASVMERSIAGMRDILPLLSSSVYNIHKVDVALEPLKTKFTQCTEQISRLAYRVRVAALNAQIYAVGVEKGAALEVLAEQTRGISDAVLSEVGTIANQLGDLSATVEDLHQRLADFHELCRQEEILLIDETKTAVAKLERVKTDLPGHLEAIRPLQEELIGLTQQATASISFPARVAEVSVAALEFFNRNAQTGDSLLHSSNQNTIVDQRLDQLRQNYTMAHEHEVHEEVLQAEIVTSERDLPIAQLNCDTGAFAVPTPQPKEAELLVPKVTEPSVKGDDLGANVELF